VDMLLDRLRKADAHQQAAALASRAAAHAALDDPNSVSALLDSLRAAGAGEQAAALAGRLPAVGMFGLFLERDGLADQFRFGRKADGTPAAPWGWENLDLWLVPRLRGQAAPAQYRAECQRRDRPASRRIRNTIYRIRKVSLTRFQFRWSGSPCERQDNVATVRNMQLDWTLTDP